MSHALQKSYAPHNACFGCGPASEGGLHLESFVDGDRVIAEWQPQPRHQAFPNVLNGGIIGALLDCHSNWTAAWALMHARGDDAPPCTVTMDYHVQLKRPTPMDEAVFLSATVHTLADPRVRIEARLYAHDRLTAVCDGQFIAVKPGHPAYHAW